MLSTLVDSPTSDQIPAVTSSIVLVEGALYCHNLVGMRACGER